MASTTYDLNFLIDRIYTELAKRENNKNKLILMKPEVVSANKKTFIKNFRDICSKIKRSENELKDYFYEELSAQTSIDQNGYLVLQGIYKGANIQKVLIQYIKDFISCKECGSANTEIKKINRIKFLVCNQCFSKKSI